MWTRCDLQLDVNLSEIHISYAVHDWLVLYQANPDVISCLYTTGVFQCYSKQPAVYTKLWKSSDLFLQQGVTLNTAATAIFLETVQHVKATMHWTESCANVSRVNRNDVLIFTSLRFCDTKAIYKPLHHSATVRGTKFFVIYCRGTPEYSRCTRPISQLLVLS